LSRLKADIARKKSLLNGRYFLPSKTSTISEKGANNANSRNLLTTAMAVMPHTDVERALETALSLDIPFLAPAPKAQLS
jgi:hypothetical protein